MRDIGKSVGVSAVTVSKALAGKPGMSESMRQRILKKAEELNYHYPEEERRQHRKEQLDIGILIPEHFFQADSFYAVMYKQLVQQLTENGHFGMLELLSREMETGLEIPNLVKSNRVDGLILLGEPEKAYYRMIARQSLPVLFLDFYDEQASAEAVVGDNAYGCYRLTSHLIRNGHTNIGFVGSYRATSSIMDRFLGYSRALLSNDLPVREDWVLPDRDEKGQLLKEIPLPAQMPTAFVCNCDLVAVHLIRTLRAKGLRVPEDISITGFDDFVTGAGAEPELSTFRIDTDAMIDLAVRTIAAKCRGQHKPFGRTVIGGQPVYRNSDRNINGTEE